MLCKQCKAYNEDLDWCRIKLVGHPTGCNLEEARVSWPKPGDGVGLVPRFVKGCRHTPSRIDNGEAIR